MIESTPAMRRRVVDGTRLELGKAADGCGLFYEVRRRLSQVCSDRSRRRLQDWVREDAHWRERQVRYLHRGAVRSKFGGRIAGLLCVVHADGLPCLNGDGPCLFYSSRGALKNQRSTAHGSRSCLNRANGASQMIIQAEKSRRTLPRPSVHSG